MNHEHYSLVNVKRKPNDPWQPYPTRTLQHVAGFKPAVTGENMYGSRGDRRSTATGFFRVEKVDNRWWLIDPEGYFCLHRGVVSVAPGGKGSAASREALQERFGSARKWASDTSHLLRKHGFNGVGAWSAVDLLRTGEPRLSYTRIWNFMSAYGKQRGGTYQKPGHIGYPNDCIFVFDPAFETFCREYASALAETAGDPFLLGHFSDNELPFPDNLIDKYLELDSSDPGYLAAREWVIQRTGGFYPEALTDTDRDAFRGHVVERYCRIVSDAIRRYDPNHLLLGPRFHGREKRSPATFAAAGRYLDIIAVNHYWQWMPDTDWLRDWERWSGRPVIVTEWYAKGQDSGYPNTSGAGWIVETQADRGRFYQTFALGLLECQVCVGWHWFKYMDNDPADTTADPSNRDSNKGIVTLRFEPYLPLLEAMAKLNSNAYALADHFDQTCPKES